MIRAVVDTNVRFSAVLTPDRTAAKCIQSLRDAHRILISPFLLREFGNTLARKLHYNDLEISGVLHLIEAESELLHPERHAAGVCRDPVDDRVLDCAIAGKADIIVTGDNDLLSLGEHAGVRIVTPAQLRKLLQAESL